jgi:hypothetical protein
MVLANWPFSSEVGQKNVCYFFTGTRRFLALNSCAKNADQEFHSLNSGFASNQDGLAVL